MLETGILVLFLLPGLAAYAAIYGIFHDGKAIAPEPPAANAVEAVAIIVGLSVVVHAATALLFLGNHFACSLFQCPVAVPGTWLDPYASATRAVGGGGIGGQGLALGLIGVSAQALAVHWLLRRWLRSLAAKDALPAWIYGWAKDLANSLDNDATVVIAYVLTTTDCGDKAVAYGGLLHDMALKPDGCIARVSMSQCERYLVDLGTPLDTASLSDALSSFTFMVIDADNIRNVALETLHLPGADTPNDLIAPAP